MKTRRLVVRLSAALFLSSLCSTTPALGQAPCTITVRASATGRYDRFGEHEWNINGGTTGLAAGSDRDPFRSFMVFQIPPFPGVLTNASVSAYSYSIGPAGVQTLYLHEVASSPAAVAQPGFSATNIYADLGDGPVYGSQNFASGFAYVTVPLNSAVAAITAVRGQEFAMGGDQSPLTTDPRYNDFILFPYVDWSPLTLQLEISAPNPPFLYLPPTPSNLYSNDAIVNAEACGAEPLHYTWFADGTNYASGVNYRQIYFPWLETNRSVFVVVSNSFGSVTSTVATVRRVPANLRWAYTNVVERSGTSLYLPFTDYTYFVGPTSLAWFKDGQPFVNEAYNALVFPNADPTNSGDYTVVASNAWGVITSAVMRVQVVDVAPRIWEQPRSTTNALGERAHFGVTAPAGPPADFRWYHDSMLISPSPNTAAYLDIDSVQMSDAGSYYVVASNRVGMATSAVVSLTVYADPPAITAQPQSQTVYAGRSASFVVGISGTPYPSLQWYFNGEPLPGARYAALNFDSVQATNAGNYFCVASNASGIVTSEVATLTVLLVPPVLGGPDDAIAPAGSLVYMYVVISNPPAFVRSYLDGAPSSDPGGISTGPGQPTTLYYSLRLGPTNYTAQFFVVASNEYGLGTSRVASITVTTAPPAFIAQPANMTVLEGSRVLIPNYASGAPPPRQFLYRNGQDAGAVLFNGYLALFNVSPSQSGEYVIVASNHLGVATSQPFRIDVQRVGPLDRWTRRQPLPQGNDLHGVAHGQGLYVACGDVGTIITSPDATNWSVFSAEIPAELEDVAYGNGRFVCVGDLGGVGVVVASTNGETWVTQQLPEARTLRGVAFGDGRFLAIGADAVTAYPRAYVSTNGLEWSLVLSDAAGGQAEAVTFGNGRWVIALSASSARVSTDLNAWTTADLRLTGVEGVAFANGQFIAVGNNARISVSPDGTAWTAISNSVTFRRLYNVAFNAGLYVAVGARGTIVSSTTATDDSWVLEMSPTADRLEDVIHAGGLFLAVGERGTLVTSYDGDQWTEQTRGVAEDLDDLAVTDNLAIAVGKNGTILTSTDGRSWNLASLPPLANSSDWHGVGFGDGKIVVVGDSTNVLVSTDNAASWHAHPYAASASYLKSVIYAQGLWIAVGIGGVIVTSLDATNWAQQSAPVPYDLNDIAYGDGQFVVVGDRYPSPNATILLSADGNNWFNRSHPLGKNARAVTYQHGRFLIAANDGRFLSSTNPMSVSNWWAQSLAPFTGDGDNLRDVTARSNIWIAVGNDGIVVTSYTAGPNSTSLWRARQPHTVENLHGVRYFQGTFLAVGNRGIILQSDPLDARVELEREGTNLRLLFSSPYEGMFQVQETTDFNWQNAGLITNSLGTAQRLVPATGTMKFFRVVPQ